MKEITLYIIMALGCGYLNAQNAVQNNGNLQIHTGASMTVFGDLTNASTGALVNNGSLYARATITNNQAAMAVGTGSLLINGTSAQIVNGAQPFRTFNLTTNNSAGITLNANLDVSGTHTFTAGILASSATPNYLIYEAGSSHSGSSDAAHVSGWVKKIGNTNFVYPVGNNTYLRSVALNSLSSSSEFNVHYYGGTPSANVMVLPLKNVDAAEYWTVNRVSGGTAAVNMNWDNSKVGFPNWVMGDIVAASWNGTAWTDAGGTASGNVTTTGTITSSSVGTFNMFTFGSKTFPIPLTLIKFTATRQESYTRIAWTTVNEVNVSHFIVERSDDGIHFAGIGRVQARNSGNLENYFLDDTRAILGTAWYRLRSVDLDARESMSKIVSVSVTGHDQALTLLSNPVKNKIQLRAGADLAGKFDYKLFKLNGQKIQQGTLNLQNGGNYEIGLNSSIPPGTYILRVTNGQLSFEYKIIEL
jgi:hypothetical protein